MQIWDSGLLRSSPIGLGALTTATSDSRFYFFITTSASTAIILLNAAFCSHDVTNFFFWGVHLYNSALYIPIVIHTYHDFYGYIAYDGMFPLGGK
jgi:hypothetical protein